MRTACSSEIWGSASSGEKLFGGELLKCGGQDGHLLLQKVLRPRLNAQKAQAEARVNRVGRSPLLDFETNHARSCGLNTESR